MATVLVIPAGLTLGLFSYELTVLWTGSANAARHISAVATILGAGSTLLALQIIPYNLALAHGWTSLNVTLSGVSVVVIVPLLIVLVRSFGLVGGGIAWLCLNAAVTPPFIYLLHRRLLPGETGRWYLADVGRPLLAALACVALGRWLIPATVHGVAAVVGLGGIAVAGVGAAVLATPGLVAFALKNPWAEEGSLD